MMCHTQMNIPNTSPASALPRLLHSEAKSHDHLQCQPSCLFLGFYFKEMTQPIKHTKRSTFTLVLITTGQLFGLWQRLQAGCNSTHIQLPSGVGTSLSWEWCINLAGFVPMIRRAFFVESKNEAYFISYSVYFIANLP